ncbi:MAG: 16S rRNA (guanine(966)-N(2))-methyltransferase RsmD [Clostridiales bacterium]|jgi:16S rRNA (guanine(966)-N(2))-methyltransferase RsmD|nr:16S rRNA (guanine(966)-N(2))-methyltransferase RsmD [Clostridiales bacterium]
MRVISGSYGGRNLFLPDTKAVRPTGGRAKEALFSILGADVMGASVLDLFSGSGALGIEALSRGAKRVVFADIEPRYIKKNLALIGEEYDKTVYCGGGAKRSVVIGGAYEGTLSLLARAGEAFDIIFLDPPYNGELGESAIAGLINGGLVADGGKIIFEHSRDKELKKLPDCAIIYDERRYGIQALSFIAVKKQRDFEVTL